LINRIKGVITMIKFKKHRNETGFTLLEVLIALILVSIGLIALAAIYPSTISNVRETARKTTAVDLIETYHEIVRNMKYKDIKDNFEEFEPEPGYTMNIDVDDGDDGSTIEAGDAAVMAGLKRVTIKVEWRMQNNNLTSLEVMTLISKKQVNQLDRMFGS
jgi:prepilin-type N-terminal cleavage/methylation domain-containing protein